MINVVAICGAFSGIVLITYLLIIGKIGSASFVTLFLGIAIVATALYLSDRLKELDIKNLRLILAEVKEVKKDIYAKAETVKKLGEELADLTAFNVTSVGRFASKDLKEKMIEARDRINAILKEVGSDENEINRVSARINDTVLRDLKLEVHSRIQEITYKIFTSGKQIDRNTIHKRAEELLIDKYDRTQLIAYLKEQGVYQEDIEELLDRVDHFIATKNLNFTKR